MNASDTTTLAVHIRRIYSEYLEMPGLRLTCGQAQRLFGVDAATCTDALQFLVDARFLRRTDNGDYMRLADGSVGEPALRIAKAQLRRSTTRRLTA